MKRLYILFTIIAGLTFNGAFSMQGQQSRKRKRPVMEKRLAHGESEKYIPTQGAHKKRKRVQKKQGLIQKQDGADVPTRQTVKNHNKKNVKTAPRKRKRLKKQGFPTAQSDLPVRVSEKVEDEEQDDDTLVSQFAKKFSKPIEEIKGFSCLLSEKNPLLLVQDILYIPPRVAGTSMSPLFRAPSTVDMCDIDRVELDKKKVKSTFVLKQKERVFDFFCNGDDVYDNDDYDNKDFYSYELDDDYDNDDHPTGDIGIMQGKQVINCLCLKDVLMAYKAFVGNGICDDDSFIEFRHGYWQKLINKMDDYIRISAWLLSIRMKKNNINDIIRLLFLSDYFDIKYIFDVTLECVVSLFKKKEINLNQIEKLPDHIKKEVFKIIFSSKHAVSFYDMNLETILPETVECLFNLIKSLYSKFHVSLRCPMHFDVSWNKLTDFPWGVVKRLFSSGGAENLYLYIAGNHITIDDIPDYIKRNKKIKIDIVEKSKEELLSRRKYLMER